MKLQLNKYMLVAALLAGASMTAQSATRTGTILKTLSDGQNYGGCMIQISNNIGNGCPSNWVSLDCNGGFSNAGERHYASALMAFSLGKSVTVHVDSTSGKTYNTFCVATRIDVLQ